MTYQLSDKSRRKLNGVHKDLIAVVETAIKLTPVDFCVGCGLRTKAEQVELVKAGKSKTLDSRHITGHAVDLYALPSGTLSWDFEHYERINEAMQRAAELVGVPIVWGGDWKTFRDGVHWQLPRLTYK